ncbi:glycosyl hydrolase family 61-domain-containing protein [Crassisporium funariophilum]|nr:glycosyl hydrolase family 61-domain-containing protein [Crassisporium funariophilum]
MFTKHTLLAFVLSLVTLTTCHYTFPSLVVNGAVSAEWANVRKTNNYNSQQPVVDVASSDFRCYNSQTGATAQTATVAAGSQIGFRANQNVYHPGVVNVYMAKAPGSVSSWDGSGSVWFKAYVLAVTDGGKSITFPAQNINGVTFTVPRSLPSGEYLVRIENVALHAATNFQGAQWYISCGQINVTGGGSGKPGPLVAIPGVYTGREPGIMINIYSPIPATYTQPGPAVWTGNFGNQAFHVACIPQAFQRPKITQSAAALKRDYSALFPKTSAAALLAYRTREFSFYGRPQQPSSASQSPHSSAVGVVDLSDLL